MLDIMRLVTQIFGIVILIVLAFNAADAQLRSQDPGHKENAVVAGVKFSVPNGFNLENSHASGIAFMRHKKYDLALFVAVPEASVDTAYLTALSNTLVSQLFPKEKGVRWKFPTSPSDNRVSKFQTETGNSKGFNNKRLFQTHYFTIKINERQILVGYITQLGQFNNDARYLFDLEGVAGMSMPGWYAQAHILASITGEKYEEINPGTIIRGTIIMKN